MKVHNIKWNFEYGISSFHIFLLLLYFSIFPYNPLRPHLLSDPRKLDISYITYMATQLFFQFAKYYIKKSLKNHKRNIDITIESCSDAFTNHLSKCFFTSKVKQCFCFTLIKDGDKSML